MITELVGNLGGNLGLWIGISMQDLGVLVPWLKSWVSKNVVKAFGGT